MTDHCYSQLPPREGGSDGNDYSYIGYWCRSSHSTKWTLFLSVINKYSYTETKAGSLFTTAGWAWLKVGTRYLVNACPVDTASGIHLRVRRGLSTPGDYKLNGPVLSSAGALSLSQHQQCGTHYLPNKDSVVLYRLLRNIWRCYCSPARFSLSVTYCQRLCVLGHHGAIEIGLLFFFNPRYLFPREV